MTSIIRVSEDAQVARVTTVMAQRSFAECFAPIDFDRE